ncbi:MAG: hypothetical protein HY963_01045 [Ignavibacteriales bacterium]|nr:hypothetical protein [Ignavibacteriales bacterium]
MKILNAYIEGFKKAFVSKKIVTVIYGITFLLAAVLVATFKSTLTNNFGNRSELYKLFRDFDFTIYSDFINNHGDIVRPIMNQMIWFGAFYFFFTVFFAGGVLKYFDGSAIKSRVQAFFAGSAKFFFRFLRLGLYVLVIQMIIFGVVVFIFSKIISNAADNTPEPGLFTILAIWGTIHLLLFIFVSIVSDYAKIILVKEDSKKVWSALKSGLIFTFKKFFVVYPLYVLLLIVPVALVIIYFGFDTVIGMNSMFTVLVMAVIQQLFIWARWFSKVWILGSQFELFSNHLIEKMKPILTQEILLNENL